MTAANNNGLTLNLEADARNEKGRTHSVRKVYDNNNRGAVWKNERKRPGKKDADFTGTLEIDGIQYWVNGWKRQEGASLKAPAMTFSVRQKVDADFEI